MRVRVDHDACEANAVCMGIAPTVFEVDDDDTLHILMEEVPEELQDAVRRAVDGCPKRALYLSD
jgi:ferredoxin